MSNVNINEQLDTCAEMLVNTYDEILKQRQLLNEQLDSGYINLSKARSILGCTNLSMMQIPSELEPNVTVNILENNDFSENGIEYKNVDFNLQITDHKKTDKDQAIDTEKKQPVNIPLPSWFGVLTPMSLKRSQKSFANSLHLVQSICELQTRLQNLQATYKQLLLAK